MSVTDYMTEKELETIKRIQEKARRKARAESAFWTQVKQRSAEVREYLDRISEEEYSELHETVMEKEQSYVQPENTEAVTNDDSKDSSFNPYGGFTGW